MLPLPETPYVFGAWRMAKVHRDYHIEVAGHRYSVPFVHARKQVDVRVTDRTVEVFLKGQRITSHLRSTRPGRFTTLEAHMPEAHRQYLDTRDLRWRIATAGPATEKLITCMMQDLQHPVLRYRSLRGIERLGQQHGPERLEGACQRALAFGAYRYASVASILKHRLDQRPTPQDDAPSIQHANIRGANYDDESITTPEGNTCWDCTFSSWVSATSAEMGQSVVNCCSMCVQSFIRSRRDSPEGLIWASKGASDLPKTGCEGFI